MYAPDPTLSNDATYHGGTYSFVQSQSADQTASFPPRHYQHTLMIHVRLPCTLVSLGRLQTRPCFFLAPSSAPLVLPRAALCVLGASVCRLMPPWSCQVPPCAPLILLDVVLCIWSFWAPPYPPLVLLGAVQCTLPPSKRHSKHPFSVRCRPMRPYLPRALPRRCLNIFPGR